MSLLPDKVEVKAQGAERAKKPPLYQSPCLAHRTASPLGDIRAHETEQGDSLRDRQSWDSHALGFYMEEWLG